MEWDSPLFELISTASLSRELWVLVSPTFRVFESKKIPVIFYILYFNEIFVNISTKNGRSGLCTAWGGVIESRGNKSVRVAENAEIKRDLINFFHFRKIFPSCVLRFNLLDFFLIDCWFSFESDNVRRLAHCTISKWIYPIVNWRSNGECWEFSTPPKIRSSFTHILALSAKTPRKHHTEKILSKFTRLA